MLSVHDNYCGFIPLYLLIHITCNISKQIGAQARALWYRPLQGWRCGFDVLVQPQQSSIRMQCFTSMHAVPNPKKLGAKQEPWAGSAARPLAWLCPQGPPQRRSKAPAKNRLGGMLWYALKWKWVVVPNDDSPKGASEERLREFSIPEPS
jgi:hypothetical protein